MAERAHIGLDIFRYRIIIYILFLVGGLMGTYILLNIGILQGMLFYLLPFVLLFVLTCIRFPLFSFFFLYTTVFLISGLIRYVDSSVPVGIVVDLLLFFNLLVLTLNYMEGNKVGKIYFTPFLFISILWMLFCFGQLLNPMTSFSNWVTTVRNIGIHIVFFQILVFANLDNMQKVRLFFTFWAVLVLVSALKALGQKYIGFDGAESRWLYTYGAHTHVIYSGIRYFSWFTDAANFGCHMGFGIVVFSVLSFYEQSSYRRLFYILVVFMATYGMLISGTRAAIAVPFVGFTCFIVLLKEWRFLVAGFFILALLFSFFNFTTIGNSNADIRRMRTAFSFAEDASFNVRLENQAKMRGFMDTYPLGLGLGSSKHAQESDFMHGIATDSSFVFIWIETGMVGLVFYIILCLFILGFGAYYALVVLQYRPIKGVVMASTAGLAGMMVAGYGNEVLHQLPTGQTVYILMGIIMLSPFIEQKVSYDAKLV